MCDRNTVILKNIFVHVSKSWAQSCRRDYGGTPTWRWMSVQRHLIHNRRIECQTRRSVIENGVGTHASSSQDIHPPPLKRGDVHQWWLELPLGEQTGDDRYDDLCHLWYDALNEEEQRDMDAARISTVGQPGADDSPCCNQPKIERLLARAYLRTTLARYAARHDAQYWQHHAFERIPSMLKFELDRHGKPELASWLQDSNQLRFNLTHSHGVVGIAVSLVDSVGIDVELEERSTRNELRLAKRYFSDKELALLQGIEDDRERSRMFIKIWTLKEAYVKAIGRGIGAKPGFRSFSFTLDNGIVGFKEEDSSNEHSAILFHPSAAEPIKNWEFNLIRPTSRHIAALCHETTEDAGTSLVFKSYSLQSHQLIDMSYIARGAWMQS